MLEDWEAGRMTPYSAMSGNIREKLFNAGLINCRGAAEGLVLTPAGLAAARSARDGASDE
jgi:hypothetical protein